MVTPIEEVMQTDPYRPPGAWGSGAAGVTPTGRPIEGSQTVERESGTGAPRPTQTTTAHEEAPDQG